MEQLDEERRTALANAIELVPDDRRPMGFKVRRTRRSRFSENLLLRMALRDSAPLSGNMDLKILAEGDSWCNLLHPISGYPKTLVDVLAGQFYTVNLGWPGDTFEEIVRDQQRAYSQQLKAGTFDYFIFSAGGVDFFTALAKNVRTPTQAGGSDDPKAYIKPGFQNALDRIGTWYRGVAKQVTTWTDRTALVLHGYDHAIPTPGGRFLGRRFEALDHDVAGGMPRKIVKEGIDRYYTTLEAVAAAAGPRVRVVDCRGAIGTRWHDELHANAAGAKILADRFLDVMTPGTS